mgnify:CR=1 FL=1
MKPTVLLFDIDGTLLHCDHAGRRAMEFAFREVTGKSEGLDFSFAGMTDRKIVGQALARTNHPAHARADLRERFIDEVLGLYLERLAEELRQAEHYRVLPGVEALLKRLVGQVNIALGLGTGNVEAGAELKLAQGGLDRYFEFGGFGSDHEERAELLRIGVERGCARLGRPREECSVLVIGDTPKDVEAAEAIGVPCLGVCTGNFGAEELYAAGATWVAESLDAAVIRHVFPKLDLS